MCKKFSALSNLRKLFTSYTLYISPVRYKLHSHAGLDNSIHLYIKFSKVKKLSREHCAAVAFYSEKKHI